MDKKHILCVCITQPILLMKIVQPSHGGLFTMFQPITKYENR